METTPAGHAVERKLHQAWHRERRYFHTRGLCRLLIWLVALILTDLAVDWLLDVPGWGRLLLLAINLGVLGAVAHLHWFRHLRRFDAARVALEVERRYPDLESLLVSYVQLCTTKTAAIEWGASPGLVAALGRQAVQLTAPLDFRQIVNFRELKRIAAVALAIFAFFMLLGIQWPEYFRTLALRMFNPAANLAYPTRTILTPLTGDMVAKQGATVTVKVRADGIFPGEGRLHVRPENGEWQKWTIKEGAPNEFAYSVENAYESFDYYMKIGDARTPIFRVQVVPPPRLLAAQVRVNYPAYTGRSPQSLNTLSPEVLEGSEVEWRLGFATPVGGVTLLPREGQAVQMNLEPNGLACWLKRSAGSTLAYTLRWADARHGFSFDEGVEHLLRVVADSPPEAELLQPLGDELGTVQKTLNLTFRAVDDFGVDKAWLMLAVNDGAERAVPIVGFQGRAVEQFKCRAQELATDLKPGDVVTFVVEVSDQYPGKDGPHKTRTQSRRLTVLSLEEYQKHIAQQLAGVTDEVKRVYQSELEASDQVKILEAGD